MALSNLDALPGQETQVQRALQETIEGPNRKDTFGNVYFGDLEVKRRKLHYMLIWMRLVFSSIESRRMDLFTFILLADGGAMWY